MKFEWIDKDFFCVNGKYPYYNINMVKKFTVREEEIDIFGHKEFKIVLFDRDNNKISLYTCNNREEANNELKNFLKSRGIAVKDDEKILVD